jgi:pyrroline-5-carboxylate reductase
LNVTFIGGGVMGEAILSAALKSGLLAPGDVTVVEIVEARRAFLSETYGVHVADKAAKPLKAAAAVILAVKPQDMGSVAGTLRKDALLLSIMAGVTIGTVTRAFDHGAIVRVMPNTPATIGEGMSVWTATGDVTDTQKKFAGDLLGACGRQLYVASEKKLDMATALSGSGPGYVFLMIEAMIEGGVIVGLTRAEAEEMAIQTVFGSAAYALQTDDSPADLRARVTSPAGTTAAGLQELEKAGVRAGIIEAIRAAHRRSVELGSAE